LVGPAAFIEQARIYRKMYGGGMRQAGVLAAAGLIALEKSPLRLAEDHANARYLAEGITHIAGLEIDPSRVRTNIVIFDCAMSGRTAVELCQELERQGLWAQDTAAYSVRFVTHADVDRGGCERALGILGETLAKSYRRSA
jgi:threonine aldolase